MSVQKYPFILEIYKGEGRLLIVPLIEHIGGYSVESNWFINIENMEDITNIGESLLSALNFIKNSPLSIKTPKELDLDEA